MIEGVNYRKQTAIAGGTIPDVTFMLPRDLLLHMDVKFPVDNYLRHLEATTDAERQATCTAFLRDVRTRIKELANRGYADPATTAGYVLLFIPNESVYAFIQEHDREVGDFALAQGRRAVLAVHAVRGARRDPPSGRLLPPRAGLRRDPRRPRPVLRPVDPLLRPRRQAGQAAQHRAGHVTTSWPPPAGASSRSASTRSTPSAPDGVSRRRRRRRNPGLEAGQRPSSLGGSAASTSPRRSTTSTTPPHRPRLHDGHRRRGGALAPPHRRRRPTSSRAPTSTA